jgi:hypothetical protein
MLVLTVILESAIDPESVTAGRSLPSSTVTAPIACPYPLHCSLSERKDRHGQGSSAAN